MKQQNTRYFPNKKPFFESQNQNRNFGVVPNQGQYTNPDKTDHPEGSRDQCLIDKLYKPLFKGTNYIFGPANTRHGTHIRTT